MFFSGTNLTCFKQSMNLPFYPFIYSFYSGDKTRVSYKKLTRSLYVSYWSKNYLTENRHA